jgi:hypothetical protein
MYGGVFMHRFIIKRNNEPVKDRGSVVHVAEDEILALENAKSIFADDLQKRDGYRDFYDGYYKTSCNATWEVYQID